MARLADLVVGAVLIAVLAWAILPVDFIATNDGPNHIASCVLAHRLDNPSSPLHAFIVSNTPIAAAGYDALCGGLISAFDWKTATRLSLLIIGLLMGGGFWFLAHRTSPDHPLRFWGFALALPWVFYMGFWDHLLVQALALWLAGAAASPHESKLRLGLLSIATFLLTVGHVFGGAVAGALLLTVRVGRAAPGLRMRRAIETAIVGLPAAGLAAFVAYETATKQNFAGVASAQGQALYLPWGERFVALAETFAGGPALRSYGLAAIALACLVGGAGAALRKRTRPLHLAMLVFALGFVVAYFIAPRDFPRWSYAGPRLLLAGLLLAPLAVPPLQNAIVRHGVHAATVAAAVASLWWSGHHHRDFAPTVDAALSGINVVPAGPLRLPAMFRRSQFPFYEAEPLISIGRLYLVNHDVIDPFLFAQEPLTDSILFKGDTKKRFPPNTGLAPRVVAVCPPGDAGCPPLPAQFERHVLFATRYSDTVLLDLDDTPLLPTFQRRGFKVVFSRTPLHILVPQPAKLEVLLKTEQSQPLPTGTIVVRPIGLERFPIIENPLPKQVIEPATPLVARLQTNYGGPVRVEVIAPNGAAICPSIDIRLVAGGTVATTCSIAPSQ